MRGRVVAIIAVIASTISLATPAHAIVVLKKGAKQPLLGHLVRENETAIVIRESLDGGETREHTIPRSEIDELLITVSPERLAALDPSQPQLYREYAEELAEKARDPEAREAAVRLFHIAAHRGEGQLRKSALLGLASLASTPPQERHWRAAAFVFDPAHDPATIERRTTAPAVRTSAGRQSLAELLHAVRAIRQARPSETRRILDGTTVGPALDFIAKTITREELAALATTKPISDASLRQLLTAEVALEQALRGHTTDPPPEPVAKATTTDWSRAVRPGGLAPLPSLDLLYLTPYDPRACVFRSGKWVVP